ncbi:MAG TPA: hypothetical protein PKD91_00505 [Bacteroidia bacterium]|nr:hypothetical protein [Bacteroidia bacterium]
MKKLLFVVALAFSTCAFAQNTMKEDIDIIQSVYGKSKKELVGSYMKLAEPQATAFWKVYDEYEVERKELSKEKMRLIADYAKNYETLNDAKADELALATLKNNLNYEKLYSKYYGKVKKVVGALSAARFMQLETYLQTTIRSEIQEAIPFISDVDKSKTN